MTNVMDNIKNSTIGYDSSFEDSHELKQSKRKRQKENLRHRQEPIASSSSSGLPSRSSFGNEESTNARHKFGSQWQSLNAYERHKQLINHYVLYHPGSTNILQRNNTNDKTDHDVLKENHKFLWNDDDVVDSWGKELAKKYYDKLFKEYCICDLTRYKENKIGMRWRIEKEVFDGRGQFSCGNKHCSDVSGLRTWEMNFSYVEHGEKKNCLVKLRLCHACSWKLNFSKQRREVTSRKRKRKRKIKKDKVFNESPTKNEESYSSNSSESDDNKEDKQQTENDIWKGPIQLKSDKSKEEEFEDYLNDLFL